MRIDAAATQPGSGFCVIKSYCGMRHLTTHSCDRIRSPGEGDHRLSGTLNGCEPARWDIIRFDIPNVVLRPDSPFRE